MLTEAQISKVLNVAKVCGNCVHGQGFYILRGRIFHLIENSIKDLQIDSLFLNPETVDAFQTLLKVSEWKSYCKIEKVNVKMLDIGCGHWEPSVQSLEE